MTQKEKELFLKDLCGRIPYNIKFNFCNNTYVMTGIRLFVTDDCGWDYGVTSKDISEPVEIGFIKPYLRSMSSMTDEEREDIKRITGCGCVGNDGLQYTVGGCVDYDTLEIDFNDLQELLAYLNAHHLDYRGLIDKGLAVEAPEGTYNIK